MEIFIKEFVKNMQESDIYNYALKKENITLTDNEVKTIYMYIKNYWQVFYKGDPTNLFEELKDMVEPKTYDKLIELYNKYKKNK